MMSSLVKVARFLKKTEGHTEFFVGFLALFQFGSQGVEDDVESFSFESVRWRLCKRDCLIIQIVEKPISFSRPFVFFFILLTVG